MRPLLVALVALTLVGCGGNSEPAGSGGAITVQQALASRPGQPLLVQGALIASAGTVRLCSAVLESYPPQCGQPSLVVQGLDLNTIPALTTANGVTWSDHEIKLRGTVDDGMLAVA
jgi:hypothetical protein